MLQRISNFTRENYHDTGPKGARFVLFQGPENKGYIRLSENATEYHTAILDRFMSEIQITTDLPPEGFSEKGGGYYFLTFNKEDTPVSIKFWKDSTNYGRFDEALLSETLNELTEEMENMPWIIE